MIDCPTCDDYQAPTKAALRSHANAKTDHDWSEIKDQLTDPDDQPESSDEQGDNQEETETDGDEQGDPSVEQDEASETSENDQPESSENQEEPMVSEEELRKQREQSSETTSENSQTATAATTSQSSQPSKGIPLPIPRSWLLAAAALVALGLVGAWVMQGSSDDDQPEPTDEELGNLDDVKGGGLMPDE